MSDLTSAIKRLGKEFDKLDLSFHSMDTGIPGDVTSYWPGKENENIMVCVFDGKEINEPFHRQDFFFINYAWKNSYNALSAKYNNLITIGENECYIGQPYSGYALRANNENGVIIIGILIRKDFFFKKYLPAFYTDNRLFHFFIDPNTNKFSDEFLHLSLSKTHPIRRTLENMVMEYVNGQEYTQPILESMLQTLCLQLTAFYRLRQHPDAEASLSEQILRYVSDHSDVTSLKAVAAHFSYHPNYISGLIKRETGKSFREILTANRMERAALLLKNTSLSVEEIASMLGYPDKSNFFKSFKNYFGCTPREYIQ